MEALSSVAASPFWAVGLLMVRLSKTVARDVAMSVLMGAAVWVLAGASSLAVNGVKPGGRIAAFLFTF